MSKTDAQRAMREANYARRNAAAKTQQGGAKPAEAKPSSTTEPTIRTAAKPRVTKTPTTSENGSLCGHRNMGGKKCSRPAGHAEKNHRYK